jgi:hypothetical protein
MPSWPVLPPFGDSIQLQPWAWSALSSWFCTSFISCSLLYALVRLLLPNLFAAKWEEIRSTKPHRLVDLCKEFTCFVPSTLVPLLCWRDVWDLTAAAIAAPTSSMSLASPRGLWSACGAIFGYMVFDLVMLLVFARDLRRSMGGEMYWVVWGHHLLSLALWPVGLGTDLAVVPIGWFLLSEVSNTLLALRNLMKYLELRGPLFTAVSASWLLLFTLVRIVPLPLLGYFLGVGATSHQPAGLRALVYGTVPLPLLLNAYWFFLAIDGARRMLKGKSPKGE